jgi:hypothetical protein
VADAVPSAAPTSITRARDNFGNKLGSTERPRAPPRLQAVGPAVSGWPIAGQQLPRAMSARLHGGTRMRVAARGGQYDTPRIKTSGGACVRESIRNPETCPEMVEAISGPAQQALHSGSRSC